MDDRNVFYCAKCGKELTDKNIHDAETISGMSLYCTDCEEKAFSELEKSNGAHFALFLCCSRFDVPCEPQCLPEDFGTEEFLDKYPKTWKFYLERLSKMPKYAEEKKKFCFKSGQTSFLRIFGKDMTEKTFAAYVKSEIKAAKEKGTEEQIEKWGKKEIGKGLPMTAEIYDELDRLYDNRRQNYEGQTITPQMEETLHKVSKWNFLIDHYIRNGDMQSAKNLSTMVDNLLASEQMRKKDEKQTEEFTVDRMIKAFQRKGYMEGDNFVPFDKLISVIADEMHRKKYNCSVDAIHQLELNIINNARKNSDLPMLAALPSYMKIEDASEFEEIETEEEKNRKKECNLTTVQFFDEEEEEKSNAEE